MKIITAAVITAAISVAACANSGGQISGKKWVGVFAVKESPLVNQVVRESGNEPSVYYPRLRQLADSGQVQYAPGNYCLVPYAGGSPAEKPECFTTTGVYTMWAPASFVSPGRAMCAQAPSSWPAIAGQRRYPDVGGKSVNCYDFDAQAASASFAGTRDTAAMVVLIQPAG